MRRAQPRREMRLVCWRSCSYVCCTANGLMEGIEQTAFSYLPAKVRELQVLATGILGALEKGREGLPNRRQDAFDDDLDCPVLN